MTDSAHDEGKAQTVAADAEQRMRALIAIWLLNAGQNVATVRSPEADIVPPALRPTIALRDLERIAIMRAMTAAEGNKVVAARQLGISRATLYRKLQEYGAVDAAQRRVAS